MTPKKIIWEVKIIAALIFASLVLNLIHFIFFKDLNHIWLWSLTSLAFLPISVLVFTLFIDRLLSARENAMRLDKINMLIGAFFSNVGIHLLRLSSNCDPDIKKLREHLVHIEDIDKISSKITLARLDSHHYNIIITADDLPPLRKFLIDKTDFLMRLFENQSILDHEAFTDMLRAVFHLAEELTYRESFNNLPKSDIDHISNDTKRAYRLIVREWFVYLKYLKQNYPYLFSLAVRINPLLKDPSPVVK